MIGAERVAFGKPLSDQWFESIALSRIEIDQARLLTEAANIDSGAKSSPHRDRRHQGGALVACDVIDRAMSRHGGAGVGDDTARGDMPAPDRCDWPTARMSSPSRYRSSRTAPPRVPSRVRDETLRRRRDDRWLRTCFDLPDTHDCLMGYRTSNSPRRFEPHYRLGYGGRDRVLRRPPAGTTAASAHDMGRVARHQSRARSISFVPRTDAIAPMTCDTSFYVMEPDGTILRPESADAHRNQARDVGRVYVDDGLICTPSTIAGLSDWGRAAMTGRCPAGRAARAARTSTFRTGRTS